MPGVQSESQSEQEKIGRRCDKPENAVVKPRIQLNFLPMKTLAVTLLLLCGAALVIRQNHLIADPSGKIAFEKNAQQGDTLSGHGLLADPTGTIGLRQAPPMAGR